MADEPILDAGEELPDPSSDSAGSQDDGDQGSDPQGDAGDNSNETKVQTDSELIDSLFAEADPDADPEAKLEPAAKDDAPADEAEAEGETPPADGDEKPAELELDDADKALLGTAKTEKQRDGLTRLFTERKELREQTEALEAEVAPIRTLKTELQYDDATIAALVDQERMLASMPPDKAAAYLRAWADKVSPLPPPPPPIDLPKDLEESVEAQILSKDEAEIIARKRLSETPEARAKAAQEKAKADERALADQQKNAQANAAKAEVQKVHAEIGAKGKEYATRWPADWPKVTQKIVAEMKDYGPLTPAATKKIVLKLMADAAAKLQAAKPTRPATGLKPATSSPNGQKPRPSPGKVMTDDEVLADITN
jgi:hypothetical protein